MIKQREELINMNSWKEMLEQIEKELSELDKSITKTQSELNKKEQELKKLEEAATTFDDHKKLQSFKEEVSFLQTMLKDLNSKRKAKIDKFTPQFNTVCQGRLDNTVDDIQDETMEALKKLKENTINEYHKIVANEEHKLKELQEENEQMRERLKKIFDDDTLTEKGYVSLRSSIETYGFTSFYHSMKVRGLEEELNKLSI